MSEYNYQTSAFDREDRKPKAKFKYFRQNHFYIFYIDPSLFLNFKKLLTDCKMEFL